MKKRLFLSDVHMGKYIGSNINGDGYPYNYVWLDSSGKKDQLLGFLAVVASNNSTVKDLDEVVLVGDIMDDWVCPSDVVPPSMDDILTANSDIVNALKAIMNKGIEVRYLPGNHDMSIDKGTMVKHLGHAKFSYGGNHASDLRYEADNIISEHGTSSAMFNGPDPTHDPVNKLPLGYFITRLGAYAYAMKEIEISLGSVLVDYLPDLISGKSNGGGLTGLIMRAVCKKAGLDTSAKIYIRPGSTFLGTNRGYVTVDEVITQYEGLYSGWESNKPKHMLQALPALFVDNDNVELMVEPLCKDYSTGVAVMGHTHVESCIYSQKGPNRLVYANCGCWCNHPGKMINNSGHFVITETDDKGRTKTQLYYWDGNTIKTSGNKKVYPPPAMPPMSKPIS